MVGLGELLMAKRRMLESLEELMRVIESLAKESSSTPIIVEGFRDAEALRKMGVRGQILILRSARNLRRYLEERGSKRVILLLDFDTEGTELMAKTIRELEGAVPIIDTWYWNRLKRFKHLGLLEVEYLPAIISRLSKR